MSSYLNETGLAYLWQKIKATFIKKSDTTPATSIGIDSTPTANSSNLVTSGGVKSALDTKQSTIDSSHKLSADLIQDGSTNKVFTSTEKTKLSGIASGAEVNVQSNWNETDTTSDAYIQNKPTIPAAQIQSDWEQTTDAALDYIKNKPNEDNWQYISVAHTFTDVNGAISGARVVDGVLTSDSNCIYKTALLTDLGIVAGDKLRVRARQSYNTTQYLFIVSFFNSEGNVAIGDEAVQYDEFYHVGVMTELGDVIVPENATHICLSHYKHSSAVMYQQCLEVIKIIPAGEEVKVSVETNLLEGWTTKYDIRNRRPLRGDTGAIYGNNYGDSGVYYGIADYIDVRNVKQLVYRFGVANAGPSGVEGMAVLAAYTSDKTYDYASSIVMTGAGNTSGIWIRPSNIYYIRFTVCTTRGEFYCVNPDRIGTLENAASNLLSTKADKATTLAGYGITDASISSGTITLGNNSITPLTSHQDISGKEDRVAISTISGTSLSAVAGTYYVGSSIGTLAVTLPTITDATHGTSVTLNIATGSSPNVTFTAASGVTITKSKGFTIAASKEYEIICFWNGTKWLITMVEFSA